jgi:hypothetical protein
MSNYGICDNNHIIVSEKKWKITVHCKCPVCELRLFRAVWDDNGGRYVKVRPSKQVRLGEVNE